MTGLEVSQANAQEQAAMRRAIELARRGLGTVSPNPVVGCVVLDEAGEIAGQGWHVFAGGPHAEVVALREAGERARRGTAVVTLEPCSHIGRTGACTTALLRAGVSRVVYAVDDPDPVAAGGANVLRATGVEVASGLLRAEAERVNEAWLHSVRRGRPFVIWKYGASLDGQIAAADGTSRWITGEQARRDAHRLRAEVDAIAVGVGTVLADDPLLTVRPTAPEPAPARQPIRVVFDRSGRTPPTAKVCDDSAETVITAEPPEKVLAILHSRGVVSVLLEGGPTLAGAFWDDGLIDKVVGYVSPVLLGSGRYPALRSEAIATITAAPRLVLDDVTRFGADVRLTSYPKGA
jgi:diaminohydroxyphosphoribosylaminopyrimidine deaminase/5-amino-6-(5-phosphoribosylamino)uracil reductase